MSAWKLADIPDLAGKTTVVTGGNVGLGFASALWLARNAARVVVACRDTGKGEAAAARLKEESPGSDVGFLRLDLTDLESIKQFAHDFTKRHDRLDILLNNAGVVNLEDLRRSPGGHEMHLATNHLGHFALTGRLFPMLVETAEARVVTVSSAGYRFGEIRFDDLDWTSRPYDRIKAYGDSKLANLLFMRELDRRFRALGVSAISIAAHPGVTATERQQAIGIGGALAHQLASPMEKGVRSQLRAATDPSVSGGEFYGPRFGLFGPAVLLKANPAFADIDLAEKLWHASEEITGVNYAH